MYFGLDIVDRVADVFIPSKHCIHHYSEYFDGDYGDYQAYNFYMFNTFLNQTI
jgi:hypothetical protein